MRSTNYTLFLFPLCRILSFWTRWIDSKTLTGLDCWLLTVSKQEWKQQVRGCWGFFLHTDFYFQHIEKEPIQLPPHFPLSSHQKFWTILTPGKKIKTCCTESAQNPNAWAPTRLLRPRRPDGSVDVAKHRSPSSPCELYDVDFDWWGNQTESSSAASTELWNH